MFLTHAGAGGARPSLLCEVVLTAVYGLLDLPALVRLWRVSRIDFYAAAIALAGVLLLGILEGILLAALASILMLLVRAARPHVAFLGRIPGTRQFSDFDRHPDNEPLPGIVIFRPEASLLYVNAEAVQTAVLPRALGAQDIRLVVCDLSASPYVDLAGSRMLREMAAELAARRITLRVVGARGRVRDLLRADDVEGRLGALDRALSLDDLIVEISR
ncbi:MAG: STAS domain-containing protein [Hyphomicrobiales bacterium]|nr:STAS domain-containing protein [Hyphomicrobiales bacterium]